MILLQLPKASAFRETPNNPWRRTVFNGLYHNYVGKITFKSWLLNCNSIQPSRLSKFHLLAF